MALFKRQTSNFVIIDDQSPTLWSAFQGNWTHYPGDGFYNDTLTTTPTPGGNFVFQFSGIQIVYYAWPCRVVLTLVAEIGTQAWLYGALMNITSPDGEYITYPTADYKVDGAPSESSPVLLPDKT
jgi:hypothetical protein